MQVHRPHPIAYLEQPDIQARHQSTNLSSADLSRPSTLVALSLQPPLINVQQCESCQATQATMID